MGSGKALFLGMSVKVFSKEMIIYTDTIQLGEGLAGTKMQKKDEFPLSHETRTLFTCSCASELYNLQLWTLRLVPEFSPFLQFLRPLALN